VLHARVSLAVNACQALPACKTLYNLDTGTLAYFKALVNYDRKSLILGELSVSVVKKALVKNLVLEQRNE
jgi:hypothetical protein